MGNHRDDVTAVIGLGNMGLAMGRRIVGQGYTAYGVDTAAQRRTLWSEVTGMPATATVTELPTAVRRALVVVRLAEQATAVLDDLTERDELVCYVATTLDTTTARGLGGYAGAGRRVVELPVSGGEGGAAAGELTVLAAGGLTEADRDFLTATIAAEVVTFEHYGEPTLAKLLNNVAGAYNALALARILELADTAGLDPRRLREVLLTSSGGSWMTRAFDDLRDDLLAKDVGLLRSEVGDLPLVALDSDTDLPEILGRARDLLR